MKRIIKQSLDSREKIQQVGDSPEYLLEPNPKTARRRAATLELLAPTDAARMIGVAPKTLANWRWRGFGPSFIKFGPAGGRSAVRYDYTDVENWIAAMKQQHIQGIN